jgi:peptide/nickel transport system permease protein
LSFVLLSLVPGNAAEQILGFSASKARVAALEHQLGLDRPLWTQYWRWLMHALHGDLGNSIFIGNPVGPTIVQRLPVTLSLILGAIIVMPGIGITLGIYSAVRGGIGGRVVDTFALVGFALPSFWFGAILIEFFAVKLHLFPAIGYVSFAQSPSEWLRSLVLPVIALSIGGIAGFSKYTRDATLDVLASEHIRIAHADGMPPHRILFIYALKNTGLRVVTMIGLLTIGLLGGTAFVETIFALPGLGNYLVTGVQQEDVPVVQGVTVVFTLIIIFVNLITDLAYSWLDPRVRTS